MLCLLALLALRGDPVSAHGGRPFTPGDGLRIESLTHGQMAVLARYRAEILAVADRQYPPDETLRRLANHSRLQFAWCAWGLMPGTIRDETSPFNICAHAYLAAARAALLRMIELPSPGREIIQLRQRIDDDMALNGASLVLCAYSADAFRTGEIIGPDWTVLPRHIPSLALLAALLGGAAIGLNLLRLPRAG